MEALNLLTLWQTDDEEDSFFDIDFTVPIKRKIHFVNKHEKVLKTTNVIEEVPMFSLIANATSSSNSSKRFGNNVVRKYMRLIKPLYSKASKIKFSNDVLVMEKKSPLREVCKQLRKSRSASSAVRMVMERRDDSLLQQNDGIQSAILHCRKSYYSSRDSSTTFLEEGQRRISI